MNRINSQLAAKAILNAIHSAWTTNAASDFKLTPENHTEALPPLPGKNHARAFLRPAGASNFALGANGDYIRGVGLVMVQVFIRRGGGSIAAQVASDYLESVSNTQIASLEATSSLKILFGQTGPAMFSGSDEAFDMYMIHVPYQWDSLDSKSFAP